MCDIIYRKLENKDLSTFITMRMGQLQEEGAESTFDLEPSLKEYYRKHMSDNTFVSWVATVEGNIIATSGMSFVERPPYYSNPTGKVGFLSSMYTLKKYRRKGIANTLLEKVVEEAKNYGCKAVFISASDMGVLLYNNFGFEKNGKFMQYNIDESRIL